MALLADLSFIHWVLCLALIGVCALLILVVLVQQASGGGLVGAFGGGGGGGAFGAKTGDLFTVITVALAGVFLLLSIVGNYSFRPLAESTPIATVSPSGAVPPPGQAEFPVDFGNEDSPVGSLDSSPVDDDAADDTLPDDDFSSIDDDESAAESGTSSPTEPVTTDDSTENP